MRREKGSIAFAIRSVGASTALAAVLAQVALLPLARVSRAAPRASFELGLGAGQSRVSLSIPEAQSLLQQLDQAVAEELVNNPELLQAVQDAVDEQWPAIEANLPEVPTEEAPAPAPSAEPIPAPAPSAEPIPAPAPSAEPIPAPAPSAEPSPRQKQGPRESWEKIFGWDFQLAAPGGVGLAINVTPVRPITVSVGVSTPLGVTVTAQADVTLNILPIFWNSRWTPTVTVGYRYVHFTGLTDAAIGLISGGKLEESGIAFQLKGTGLHMVTAMTGLEYVSRKGFHLGLRGGYIWQVGESVGQTDESGVVFSNFRSWSVLLLLGRRY